MTSPTGNGEYEVGYGKPPKQHRFQKGRSGNPRGRPKGSRNIKTVLESALTKTQPVREDGKVKHLSNIDIIILQLVAKALKGDIKATAMLLQVCAQHDLLGEVTDTTVPADADDRALIESFLSRLNTQGGAS